MRRLYWKPARGAVVVAVLLVIFAPLACRSRPPGAAPDRADETIAAEVRQRLERVRGVDAAAIEVRVHEGVVELRGVVRSPEQARDALRQAGRARGVRQVVNRLVILDTDITGT